MDSVLKLNSHHDKFYLSLEHVWNKYLDNE